MTLVVLLLDLNSLEPDFNLVLNLEEDFFLQSYLYLTNSASLTNHQPH
jgi:hypothetical protein